MARGKRITKTAADVKQKTPIDLPIPVREITTLESITLGFRTEFFSCAKPRISVTSGAGCGSLWITMEAGERHACVNAGELLVAWVRTFDPAFAEQIQASLPDNRGAVTATSIEKDSL